MWEPRSCKPLLTILVVLSREIVSSLNVLLSPGLSPPTYATFQATPALIPTETTALYPSSALLPTARVPAAPAPLAYYPGPAAQLYMNYTAYYPRYLLLGLVHSPAATIWKGPDTFLAHITQDQQVRNQNLILRWQGSYRCGLTDWRYHCRDTEEDGLGLGYRWDSMTKL